MKNRQKQGCNQNKAVREDVTAVLPMKTGQKLHRCIFLGIKGVGGKEPMTISRSEANGGGESHRASITNDPTYGELLRLRITESRD
jgi:hypothetical protein